MFPARISCGKRSKIRKGIGFIPRVNKRNAWLSIQPRIVHELIKQGAKLVGSVEDILEELALPMQISLKSNDNPVEEHVFVKNRIAHLTEDEKNIYEGINREASHIDEILSKVQIPQPKAIEILLKLELKNLVRQMPGKYFVRKEE